MLSIFEPFNTIPYREFINKDVKEKIHYVGTQLKEPIEDYFMNAFGNTDGKKAVEAVRKYINNKLKELNEKASTSFRLKGISHSGLLKRMYFTIEYVSTGNLNETFEFNYSSDIDFGEAHRNVYNITRKEAPWKVE